MIKILAFACVVTMVFLSCITQTVAETATWEDRIIGKPFQVNESIGPDKNVVQCDKFILQKLSEFQSEGKGPPSRNFEASCMKGGKESLSIAGKANNNVFIGSWKDGKGLTGPCAINMSLTGPGDSKTEVFGVALTFTSADGKKTETLMAKP